jgi:hypothetical protein
MSIKTSQIAIKLVTITMSLNFYVLLIALILVILIEDTMAQYFTFGAAPIYGNGAPSFGVYGKREAVILSANDTSL